MIWTCVATGDDNTENEDQSPTKKAKGRPGRKPAQTKATKNKDTDQEAENETGKYSCSFRNDLFSAIFQLQAMRTTWKMKVHHR